MIRFLPAPIIGTMAAILFAANTTFWCVLLIPFAILKSVLRIDAVEVLCTNAMVTIAESWIAINVAGLRTLHDIRWDLPSLDDLSRDKSYLVCANHQSWVDIVILQKVFNRRVPFFRFFLKQELIYVPLLGIAWWALDFPFMKRYSKEYLEKHPEKRGEDLATTRKTCAKFAGKRISIINFLEGTRFTREKHSRQTSPYKHLLMPKTGGIAFVLEAMGRQFDSLIDVTIFYPGGAVNLWGLLSGRIREVVVRVDRLAIPSDLLGGSYLDDPVFRERMQAWIRQIWERKDALLSTLQAESAGAARRT